MGPPADRWWTVCCVVCRTCRTAAGTTQPIRIVALRRRPTCVSDPRWMSARSLLVAVRRVPSIMAWSHVAKLTAMSGRRVVDHLRGVDVTVFSDERAVPIRAAGGGGAGEPTPGRSRDRDRPWFGRMMVPFWREREGGRMDRGRPGGAGRVALHHAAAARGGQRGVAASVPRFEAGRRRRRGRYRTAEAERPAADGPSARRRATPDRSS